MTEILREWTAALVVSGPVYEVTETKATGARLDAVIAENALLRAALWEQWAGNHFEHCQSEWPHDGDCHYPVHPLLRDHQGGSESRVVDP